MLVTPTPITADPKTAREKGQSPFAPRTTQNRDSPRPFSDRLKNQPLRAMSCIRNTAGWICLTVAACLILAPVVRFREHVKTRTPLGSVVGTPTAGTSGAPGRLDRGLARWCELPGCKASETRASVGTGHDRWFGPAGGGLAGAASFAASQRERGSVSFASSAIATDWHCALRPCRFACGSDRAKSRPPRSHGPAANPLTDPMPPAARAGIREGRRTKIPRSRFGFVGGAPAEKRPSVSFSLWLRGRIRIS